MFGRSFHLFRIFGFSVRADLSWLLIAALVTWSLAGLFSQIYPDLPSAAWWWMGVFGALGLFMSIVVHELAHSLVARVNGMEMKGITLFLFGGVAEMTDEPPSAKAEFLMAIVGPLTSFAIAAICYGLVRASHILAWPTPVEGVLGYLAWINLVLAIFNLLPAFPLDGGRVARSILWSLRGNLKWATRVMSGVGVAFGVLLMMYGGFRFIMQDFVGGIWLFLIGMFLNNAAQQSYRQLLIREVLQGESINRFIQPNVQTVPSTATVQEFVNDYVYRYHFKMFPVVQGDRLLGCVSTRDIAKVPRDKWNNSTVQEVLRTCTPQNTIHANANATEALQKMSQTGMSRLMVTDDGHLQGILSLKDMMRLIALKMELEEGQPTDDDQMNI